jgi:hypothetical protein
MKSLDAISRAQRNHEPLRNGSCQTAVEGDGFLTKAATRFMENLQSQKSGASWDPEPVPARSADFQVCCIAGFQTRHPRNVPHAADKEVGDTAGSETCATPFMLEGIQARTAQASPLNQKLTQQNGTGSYHQAIRAWKALVESVGAKGNAPLFAAWAKARTHPREPGVAIRPTPSARPEAQRLAAW